MKTRRMVRRFHVLLFVLGACAFFAGTYLWIRPRTLVEKAHLVAEVPDWPVPDVPAISWSWNDWQRVAWSSELPYTWLDNTHLFAFAQATPRFPWILPPRAPITGGTPPAFADTGFFQTNGRSEYQLPEVVHALIEMDIRSGKSVRLDALSASLDSNSYSDRGIACSPDGKYLCWREVRHLQQEVWRISTLDAKTSFTLDVGDFVGWTSDSRFVDLVSTGWFQQVGIEFRKPPWNRVKSQARFYDEFRGHDLVLTPQNHLVGLNRYGSTLTGIDGSFDWVDMDLNAPESVAIHARVLPPQIDMKERHISPDGSHIAWVLVQNRESVWTPLLRRFGLHYRTSSAPVEQLCITKSDGSGFREIGLEHLQSLSSTLPFAYVNWLPDGRHLSFISHHKLYTLPVRVD